MKVRPEEVDTFCVNWQNVSFVAAPPCLGIAMFHQIHIKEARLRGVTQHGLMFEYDITNGVAIHHIGANDQRYTGYEMNPNGNIVVRYVTRNMRMTKGYMTDQFEVRAQTPMIVYELPTSFLAVVIALTNHQVEGDEMVKGIKLSPQVNIKGVKIIKKYLGGYDFRIGTVRYTLGAFLKIILQRSLLRKENPK